MSGRVFQIARVPIAGGKSGWFVRESGSTTATPVEFSSHPLNLSHAELVAEIKSVLTSGSMEAVDTFLPLADPTTTPVLGAGVTFQNSLRERRLETFRAGQMVEAEDDGRPTPYDVVYDPSNPPEVFMKAFLPYHLAPSDELWIRNDGGPEGSMGSSVPEPERFVAVNHKGEVLGFGIGSDTTARQLESLSPLYLPAAKTYFGSTTMQPWLTVFEDSAQEVTIRMTIERNGTVVYDDSYSTDQMKRTVESLVTHARTLLLNTADGSAPAFFLFTGTGIVPGVDFSLENGDHVTIDGGVLGRIESTTHVAQVK